MTVSHYDRSKIYSPFRSAILGIALGLGIVGVALAVCLSAYELGKVLGDRVTVQPVAQIIGD